MKKSFLALAMSLVAASGAHASFQTGFGDSVTGNGELILSVWDSVTQNSYTQDLGITYNQLIGGYAGSINLDSAALSIFSSTANLSTLQFSVLASSDKQYDGPNFDYAYTNAGFISTLAPGQTPFAVTNDKNIDLLSAVWVATSEYAGALGLATSAAANPVATVANGAVGYANSAVWETYLESTTNRDLSASNGQSAALWLQSFADNAGTTQRQALLGNATLNISSLSSGVLTFASATPEVPVPAAVWLMGSALAGLGSIARKRKAA